MKRELSILPVLLVVSILTICFTVHDDKDNDLRKTLNEYGQAYVIVKLTDISSLSSLLENFSVSKIDEKGVEIALSPRTVEMFIALKYDYQVVENESVKASVVMAETLAEAMEWESYPTYLQYEDIMRSFSTNYSSICSLDTIGYSINGKLLLVAKISDNVQTDEEEPEVFYSSTIHGDEIGGYVVMLRLIDYLLKNYDTDEYIKQLVDEIEIYINPLANPDGTYRTDSTITSPTRSNANGYDLNRNFPRVGSSSSAVRQQETTAMIDFMKQRHFVISANFHHGAEVVNYPWDSWSRRHPDNDWFIDISRRYADTAHAYSLTPYMTFRENGITNGADWYSITGSRQDYVTYYLYGREVTIEIDDTKMTAASNLDSLWIRNRESLLGYSENALYGITGTVTDSLTLQPVRAKVFVVDHDVDSSFVYSDTCSGVYRRLIYPGTYQLKFSSSGYIDKFIDVTVNERELEIVDVPMVPVTYVPDEPLSVNRVDDDKIEAFPNPLKAGDRFVIMISEKMSGRVEVEVFDITGKKKVDYRTFMSRGELVVPEISRLTSGVYILVVTNKQLGISEKMKIVIN